MKVSKRLVEKKRVARCDGERVRQEQQQAEESRMKRRPSKSLVQRVFELCNEVFRGADTIPYPPDSQKMKLILDRMKPDDVGLSEDFFVKNGRLANGATSPRVTYIHIYECENFSIGIFLLPTTATIPLHNHPGMTVFSKLLFGSVHLKSYDWVEPSEPQDDLPSHVALARLKVDGVFTAPCNASVLYPASGGNLHSLQAVTPCAVLDILGPPYSGQEGRDCTYYRELPYSCFAGTSLPCVKGDPSCYRWLEEIEPPTPEDFPVEGLKYTGPRIMEGF